MDEAMLKGVNANTLVYIVNALNGEVKQVNTLAQRAKTTADDAEADAQEAIYQIGNISNNFASKVDFNAAVGTIEFINETVADLIDTTTGAVNDITKLKTDVSEVKYTADSVTTSFTQLKDDDVDPLKRWIQASANGLLLGSNDSTLRLEITQSGITIKDGSDPITFWNNVRQQTPKDLTIPVGGAFTLGDFRFVARGSGNLSLVKV